MSDLVFGSKSIQYRDLKITYQEETNKFPGYMETIQLVIRAEYKGEPLFTKRTGTLDTVKEITQYLAKQYYCGVGIIDGEAKYAYQSFMSDICRLFGISYSYSGYDEDDREIPIFHSIVKSYAETDNGTYNNEIHATVATNNKCREIRLLKFIKNFKPKYTDELQVKTRNQEVILEIDTEVDLSDIGLLNALFNKYTN